MVVPFQVPEVIVPTVAKFAKVVMFGSVVVAERRLSNLSFVQYRLVPSAILVVRRPREDVAIAEAVPE